MPELDAVLVVTGNENRNQEPGGTWHFSWQLRSGFHQYPVWELWGLPERPGSVIRP